MHSGVSRRSRLSHSRIQTFIRLLVSQLEVFSNEYVVSSCSPTSWAMRTASATFVHATSSWRLHALAEYVSDGPKTVSSMSIERGGHSLRMSSASTVPIVRMDDLHVLDANGERSLTIPWSSRRCALEAIPQYATQPLANVWARADQTTGRDPRTWLQRM